MQLDRPHCTQGWLLIRVRRRGWMQKKREGRALHLHNESTTSTTATTKDLSLKQRNEFHCFREGTKYSRFSIFYFSLWLRLHCLAQSLCLGLALPLLKHFLSFLTLFVSLFLSLCRCQHGRRAEGASNRQKASECQQNRQRLVSVKSEKIVREMWGKRRRKNNLENHNFMLEFLI